jgi:hypothetical protein
MSVFIVAVLVAGKFAGIYYGGVYSKLEASTDALVEEISNNGVACQFVSLRDLIFFCRLGTWVRQKAIY